MKFKQSVIYIVSSELSQKKAMKYPGVQCQIFSKIPNIFRKLLLPGRGNKKKY